MTKVMEMSRTVEILLEMGFLQSVVEPHKWFYTAELSSKRARGYISIIEAAGRTEEEWRAILKYMRARICQNMPTPIPVKGKQGLWNWDEVNLIKNMGGQNV